CAGRVPAPPPSGSCAWKRALPGSLAISARPQSRYSRGDSAWACACPQTRWQLARALMAGGLLRPCRKRTATRFGHPASFDPVLIGIPAARDGVAQMRFGGRAIGGNAGLAIIKVGPPHVLGRTPRLGHRAQGKQGIGMAEEVHNPRIWATPLGNHGGRSP